MIHNQIYFDIMYDHHNITIAKDKWKKKLRMNVRTFHYVLDFAEKNLEKIYIFFPIVLTHWCN